MVAWDHSLKILKERAALLFEAALKYNKRITLDMEEYRDVELTCTLFQELLSEERFERVNAGIVLQSYLPDSIFWQKKLTQWAKKRCKAGAAPIHIRLVKGANLAMESVESSLRQWTKAPFNSKAETDANYKQMITYPRTFRCLRKYVYMYMYIYPPTLCGSSNV